MMTNNEYVQTVTKKSNFKKLSKNLSFSVSAPSSSSSQSHVLIFKQSLHHSSTTSFFVLATILFGIIFANDNVVKARYFGADGYYQANGGGGDIENDDLLTADEYIGNVGGGGVIGRGVGVSNLASEAIEPLIDSDEILPILKEPSNSNTFINGGSSHARENAEWTTNARNSLSKLGTIVGVAASSDFLYLFQRGNVTWNERSFNEETNIYNHQHDPISADAVVAVDPMSGEIMFTWGKGQFYMPHGISVDPVGNIWLTDVALHQAFRYKKNSFKKADLILGEKFIPGNDEKHFCKPTDVVISSTGIIYISDGYCNSRIVIFSADGQYLAEIGNNDKMLVPHSVSLLEIEDLLCVADRENGRILCYNAGLSTSSSASSTSPNGQKAGQLLFEVQHSKIHKLYAISHIGDVILALNGGSDSSVGVSLDLASEQAVDIWSPNNETFHWAHDITTSHDGRSFFVCQLGSSSSSSSSIPKVVKFDLIVGTSSLFMN